MNLDTLQKIAEAAEQHTWALTMTGPRCPWYDAPTLVKGLECSDADAEFIAAASPELMLRLIAIARAADALTDKVYDGGACLSPEWTALRAALEELK